MPPITMPTPAPPREWFRVSDVHTPTNVAEPSSVDVFIYDTIGEDWWTGGGVTSDGFRKALDAVNADEIHLFVNSPGGDVYEGIAIRNILERHPAKVIATVDSLAASAASFILTGADEVVMGPYSEMMIHDVSSIAMGKAADLQAAADMADRLSNDIAQMYADKAGGAVEDWRALMLAETWMTADEAVSNGLADRKSAESPTKGAKNVFDLGRMFNHAGRSAAPEPLTVTALATVRHRAEQQGNHSPEDIAERIRAEMIERRHALPATPGDTTTTSNEGSDMALLNEVRNRLGIPQDAALDETGVLAALDEALAERATDTTTTGPTAALPDGVVTIDATQLADLRAAAEQGVAARNEQVTARREGVVSDAVAKGRIAPANKQAWLDRLAAAPNAEAEAAEVAVLNGLASGLTVPTEPSGYTGGVEDSGDTDDVRGNELFNSLFGTTTGADTTPKEA